MVGLAYVELLRAANVQAASDNTSAEYGPLHRLVTGLSSLTEISSNPLCYCHLPEKFPLNLRNRTVLVTCWLTISLPSFLLVLVFLSPLYSHDRGYTFPCTPPDGTTSCHLHLHFHTDVLSSVPESSAKRNQCLIFINLGILASVYVACPWLDMSLVNSSLCGYDTTITPQLTTGEAIYVKESC